MASKQKAIYLLRRCIRSAKKITDAGQQLTYLGYVRDGFRRKAGLPHNSREAMLAYQDGLDQVTDMEYYQRMAALKNENNNSNKTTEVQMNIATHPANRPEAKSVPKAHPNRSEVYSWLNSHLPHLHAEDADIYCDSLIREGFDSIAFIEEELEENDLAFMKKAHKRVLMRQLEERRKSAQ